MTPLILYDGKSFLEEWFDGTNDRVWISVNESGTMDVIRFYHYVEKEVFPLIKKRGGKVRKIF